MHVSIAQSHGFALRVFPADYTKTSSLITDYKGSQSISLGNFRKFRSFDNSTERQFIDYIYNERLRGFSVNDCPIYYIHNMYIKYLIFVNIKN